MTSAQDDESEKQVSPLPARSLYEEAMQQIRADFDLDLQNPASGEIAIAARSLAVDRLIEELWSEITAADQQVAGAIALLALGGYGRRELFPYSDVDVLFVLAAKSQAGSLTDTIRRMNQALWDAGLRIAAVTRTLVECERVDPENIEFTVALLDARFVAGNADLGAKLIEKVVPKLLGRDRNKISARLTEVTRVRHRKYGDTLFHLEPNIKECPGGLRDVHVCAWLERVRENFALDRSAEFDAARQFILLVRVFLHLRHGRDDNTLDWQTQDLAATAPLGISLRGLDAAYWMRLYFRHARAIERRATRYLEERGTTKLLTRLQALAAKRTGPEIKGTGFTVHSGFTGFEEQESSAGGDVAQDPDVVLAMFGEIARTATRLSNGSERRIEQALPHLAEHLEDGPVLWRRLEAVIAAPFAGRALRSMHAIGLLELLVPEFHGIDALVIRDAYHRYTVDEHTFVVIDTLHALQSQATNKPAEGLAGWKARFAELMRDLPHPSLLFLAALLHDTGKGHTTAGHASESARMAQNVLQRLEIEPYEGGLVLGLIRNHLQMSAALRRDVFDGETIRSFAACVPTPEALRMLTLFTYADIAAVNPDAMTAWKAENLWRLHMATADFLDRTVDEERVGSLQGDFSEVLHRLHALLPGRSDAVADFLDGFPQRYLRTRSPEQIRDHFLMVPAEANDGADQVTFRYGIAMSELTLVTRDRPMLFASMAGALSAWGMNIVTADAFSNAQGIVVDSFHFTDIFRTLELNESERSRFVENVHRVLAGKVDLQPLLAARRKGQRGVSKVKVVTRLDFDDRASRQSTLLQVVAQDTPGLLHALAVSIAAHALNIEVALIDTEGETAIDVFYLTSGRGKLDLKQEDSLRHTLLEAIERNAL